MSIRTITLETKTQLKELEGRTVSNTRRLLWTDDVLQNIRMLRFADTETCNIKTYTLEATYYKIS
jgi:hypothetical protein